MRHKKFVFHVFERKTSFRTSVKLFASFFNQIFLIAIGTWNTSGITDLYSDAWTDEQTDRRLSQNFYIYILLTDIPLLLLAVQ